MWAAIKDLRGGTLAYVSFSPVGDDIQNANHALQIYRVSYPNNHQVARVKLGVEPPRTGCRLQLRPGITMNDLWSSKRVTKI